MSTRRVPVNAAWLLLGRIFAAAVTVVIFALSSHRLTFEEFGLVASTLAAGFLANMLVTFGTDTVVTRAIAADRPEATAVAVASLKLQLVAAAALVAAAGIATALGAPIVVLLQAIALLPMAGVTVAGAVLRGRERMDHLLVATVVGGVVALVCTSVFFSIRTAAWVPVAALGLGSIATAVVGGWLAQPTHPADAGQTPQQLRLLTLLREAAPFAAMVVLAGVGAQAGVLLVEFVSDELTGGYGVAVRVTEAGRLVPAAAMGAFFPAMLSGLHRTDRYRRWLLWLFVYAATATLALLALAEPINRLVFDDQPGGAPLIRVLALGLLFTVARLALSFELIADGRERVVLFSALVGAGLAIAGGVVAARLAGAQGVAWAQLAGVVASTVVLAMRRSAPTEPPTTVRVRERLSGNRAIK